MVDYLLGMFGALGLTPTTSCRVGEGGRQRRFSVFFLIVSIFFPSKVSEKQ